MPRRSAPETGVGSAVAEGGTVGSAVADVDAAGVDSAAQALVTTPMTSPMRARRASPPLASARPAQTGRTWALAAKVGTAAAATAVFGRRNCVEPVWAGSGPGARTQTSQCVSPWAASAQPMLP